VVLETELEPIQSSREMGSQSYSKREPSRKFTYSGNPPGEVGEAGKDPIGA
jgi:hypothetical protein